MSDLTTKEHADVLMHNGQQYVHIDFLMRQKADRDRLQAELDQIRDGSESVATLNVHSYRGHLENWDVDYSGNLPDGSYPLYLRPAHEPEGGL